DASAAPRRLAGRAGPVRRHPGRGGSAGAGGAG
ncbi:MAG: hypothetical protein AVDCRST_MAG40-572, partial [uncultured Gemmatimonadaceae bacterium]